MLEEGVVSNIIGKILGIGSAGLLTAWLGSLIFRGGVGVINSVAKTMGKDGITFKKGFKEETKNSMAMKNEAIKMDQMYKKYEEELSDILGYIKEKQWSNASDAFKELPTDKKNSTEIKKVLIEAIVKATKQIPVSDPTPGNECYQAIRKIMDMQTAKALAAAYQQQIQKMLIDKEENKEDNGEING